MIIFKYSQAGWLFFLVELWTWLDRGRSSWPFVRCIEIEISVFAFTENCHTSGTPSKLQDTWCLKGNFLNFSTDMNWHLTSELQHMQLTKRGYIQYSNGKLEMVIVDHFFHISTETGQFYELCLGAGDLGVFSLFYQIYWYARLRLWSWFVLRAFSPLSLTSIVAMPFYSASLIETVQVSRIWVRIKCQCLYHQYKCHHQDYFYFVINSICDDHFSPWGHLCYLWCIQEEV